MRAVGAARAAGASTRGQATILLVAGLAAVLVGALVLGAVARGVAREAGAQRAADLGALAGARVMYDAYPRLFEPASIDGRANPRHLARDGYLALARAAAERVARANGAHEVRVGFPDAATFAPPRHSWRPASRRRSRAAATTARSHTGRASRCVPTSRWRSTAWNSRPATTASRC
jgi:hypothetical protein